MVTEVQSNLIRLLKACGLSKEDTVAEVALMRTDENRQAMIDSIIALYDRTGRAPTNEEISKIGMMLTCELKPEYRDRFSK